MTKLVDTFTCNGHFFNIYQEVDKNTGVPVPNRYRCSVSVGRNPNGSTRQKFVTGTSPDKVKYKVYSLFNVRFEAHFTNNLDITLLQCLNDYLNLHYQHEKASSYETVHYRINHIMKPLIEDIKLQEFSHNAAQELIYLLDEDYSGCVVHACESILRNCLDAQVSCHNIPYNPCKNLWMPANKREEELVPFTVAELNMLFAEARKKHLDLLLLVCFYCALRIGEAIALHWSDIDWDAKTIKIQHSLTRGSKILAVPSGIQCSTKGGSSRTIYPPEIVFSYLRQAQKRQELQRIKAGSAWNENDLCFTDDFGRYRKYGMVRDNFKRFCKAINRPDASTHHLRHTMASMLLANGSTITDISYQVGHENPITTKTYLHPTEISQNRYRDQLNTISEQILGNSSL